MDVVIKCWEDPDHCSGDRESMCINGKSRLSVGSLTECPEDAIIGRDLVDCRQVSRFMLEAHKAGQAGEKLNIKIMQVKDRDEV